MAANLHVLTLTPFYPARENDTLGCFVSEPVECLARAGISNRVVAVQPMYRRTYHAEPTAIHADWFRYFALPGNLGLSTAGAFVFSRIVSRLRQLHKEHPIDIIHAHAPLPCGHAAMLLKEELGIPFVVSVHGLDVFSDVQVGGWSGKMCRRIAQRTYSAASRVSCISERVREQVLQGMSRTCRTSVVYNGVDPQLFSPSEEGNPGAPMILSVGNLIPIKGHDVLIRATASLTSEFPELRLEIIGEGPQYSALQALAADLQIEERVHFLGKCPRAEVAAAMRRCTIFALLSRYEGLGCVYLEAMATGKPVIGCRGQGIAEVILHGSNGFLVGPDNERELSLAIAMLLGDESRRLALGRAARDTILERFTLNQQAESLSRIYRECAG